MTEYNLATENPLQHRPSWSGITRRFADDRDCLAAFLALEGAEVLAGVKPGNLVNVVNRQRPCGRNLHTLWRAHGQPLLSVTGLHALELHDRGSSVLLFLYDERQLNRLLQQKAVQTILKKCGYSDPSNLAGTLGELQARTGGNLFPHEIGIFLGYPLKDVLAFMGSIRIPYSCQGPWKIYGNPRQSLALARCYRECRYRMACHLAEGIDPIQCLQEAA
jgi:hypothetical protein